MKTNIHYIFLLGSVLLALNSITTCAPKDKTRQKEKRARIKLENKILKVKENRVAIKLGYAKRIRLINIEAGEFKEEDSLNGPLLNDSKEREKEFLYDRFTLTERRNPTARWIFFGLYKESEKEEIEMCKEEQEYKKFTDKARKNLQRQAEWIEDRIKQDKERRRKERERDRNIKIALMYPLFIIMKLKSYSFF